MTKACTSVVVPKRSRMMVTVHSAIKPRGGSGGLALVEAGSVEEPGSVVLSAATLSATTAFDRSTLTIVAANAAILKRRFPDPEPQCPAPLPHPLIRRPSFFLSP